MQGKSRPEQSADRKYRRISLNKDQERCREEAGRLAVLKIMTFIRVVYKYKHIINILFLIILLFSPSVLTAVLCGPVN